MTIQERLREAGKLRLRIQINNRLRLESLAALSRVFREYGEPIQDELLGSIVFALPEELVGQAEPIHVMRRKGQRRRPGRPPRRPPARPPGRPTAPGRPK